MRFRPDLEGLRGIAVILVVLYHAGVPGMRAGSLGVDVFYVLSGYLITAVLQRELATTGKVDLAAFYRRRARRILPAAFTTLAVTLAASLAVFAPLDHERLAGEAVAAALFAANLLFASRSFDYFAPHAPSPFLHFWSLAVEEQFYLFWPVLLLAAARLRMARPFALAVLVGSLALCVAVAQVAPVWAFYSLPTRAWELALGAVLALAPIARPGRLGGGLMGLLGLLLIALAALSPGSVPTLSLAQQLAASAGTALLIATGGRAIGAAMLGLAPLRLVGRISFSLYLVHWPVIVLAAAVAGASPTWMAVAVGISVVLAALCWRFVEEPYRRQAGGATRRLWPAVAALAVAALVATPLATAASSPVPAPLGSDPPLAPRAPRAPSPVAPTADPTTSTPSTAPPTAPAPPPTLAPASRSLTPPEARSDGDGLSARGCGLSLAGDRPPRCPVGDARAAKTIALVGDSHAAQWYPALAEIAQERGWRLVPLTKDSCIFLDLRIVSIHLEREYTECARWRDNVVAELRRLQPDLVVVSSSRWIHPVNKSDADPARQAAAMSALLRRTGLPVALIADTPLMQVDVPSCLSYPGRAPDGCSTPRSYALTLHLARDGAVAAALDAPLFDPSAELCDETACRAVVGGTIAWRDDHHLTATIVRRFTPLLDAFLLRAIGR